MNSLVVICLVLLLRFLYSEASDCSPLKRCPWIKDFCYCYDGSKRKGDCKNGRWEPKNCDCPPLQNPYVLYTQGEKNGTSYTLHTRAMYRSYSCICDKRGWKGQTYKCDIPKKPVEPEETCQKLPDVAFASISYSKATVPKGYPLWTIATYKCKNSAKFFTYSCTKDGWDHDDSPTCSCPSPANSGPHQYIVYVPKEQTNDHHQFGTTATFYCKTASGRSYTIGKSTCRDTGMWVGDRPSVGPCTQETHPRSSKSYDKTTTTKSVSHHKDEQTLVIVSGTTGAILGALIILVAIVSCQRRLHYHRMRRARLRHRQDQDAFTAFITYHRDVRLMLPSYDEAVNQQEQGQPPSFEEALGHYEEPSLPSGETPASETSPSSVTNNTPTSSPSPQSNETRNSSESDSSRLYPPSGDSRFLRSLRVLFGGRPFRTDAIYCRFVPEDDANESERNVERNSRSSTAEDDLSEVLARAGFC